MATDRRVTFLIGANIQNFTKNLNSAQRRFRKFGRDMERIGSTMSRNLTLPIALAGGAAVKAAADFESSFADIRKTVDATESQFAAIEKEIRGLAKTVPTSVNELNRMAGVAGQLGIEAGNIVEFTKTIAMLGDTTDVAGEQAALSLSRFMNVMGTAEGDIDRLGSTIVGLGNNFAAMESEIVEIATSMAPLGNSIGLTEQQVLSFATTIAASGGKTEAASTAFQKTANIMKQAVIEGNSDLATFAETAGMSASEFQRAFEEDAAGALQSFLEGLRRVQEQGGSTATVLEKLGLADQRLIREFGKVLGNLDDLDRALQLSNQEWERNTALTEEAQKRYRTFNSRLGILRNNLNEVGIIIGNTLMPVVDELIEVSQEAIDFISGLSDETVRWGLAIAGVAAFIGPTVLLLGKLFTAISVLMNPIVLVGVAIAGLATAIFQNWDKITRLFSDEGPEFMAPVRRALESITRFAATTFERLQTIFVKGIKVLGGFWDLFGDDIIEFTRLTFQAVGKVITIGLSIISTLLDVWSGRFLTDWDGFLSDIEESFIDIFGRGKSLEETFKGFFEFITSIPSPVNIGAKIGTLFGASLGIAGRQELGLPTPILDDDLKETEEKNEKTADKIFGIWDDLSKKLHNLDFTLPGFSIGGRGRQPQGSERTDPGTQNISGVPGVEQYHDDLNSMKAAVTDFRTVSQIALEGVNIGWKNFLVDFKEGGEEFQRFMAQQIAGAITSFSASVGKSLAGVGNEFETAFEKVISLVMDFAVQLGTILIAIGSAMAFTGLLSGPGAAYIAIGAALVAIGTGVSAGINKRAQNREDRANQVEVPGMARGGIVPAGFPNDTFPAMLSSGETVIPAPKSLHSGRGQVIENILVLDGREIFRNQKEVKFRDER